MLAGTAAARAESPEGFDRNAPGWPAASDPGWPRPLTISFGAYEVPGMGTFAPPESCGFSTVDREPPALLLQGTAGEADHGRPWRGWRGWLDGTVTPPDEVHLDESSGMIEPLVRGGSDTLDILQFPAPAADPDLDLVAFPRIRLPSVGLPRFFGRLRGEYADDFDTHSRIGGSAHLRTSRVLGFDLEWNRRERERPFGRDERLWTGDANVVFQLVNVKMISMRAGGGVAWSSDDDRARTGVNLTYGADFFVSRPWLMTLEVDFGRISGESLTHARGTIGYVMGQFEVYTGWDWFELGDRSSDGLIGGVTLWF
ncbi:MAG TPA: hypothetical protein VML55_02350 [Planctomycetaceae bacterium]|nr:hypothetical protein [Planctomycetaceae bacterium]